MTNRRTKTDWEAVERDYRTGKFTQRELAEKYGLSHQAIGKRAREKGWVQDLGDQIRQATNAKLVADLVAKEVAEGSQQVANTVLAAAELNKQVILGQRARVGKAVEVAMHMLHELEFATLSPEKLLELCQVMTADMDDAAKLSVGAKVRDLLTLHNRVSSAQKLMDALGKAQALERQAFGLDDDDGSKESADRALSDVERAARLAAIMERARKAKEASQ